MENKSKIISVREQMVFSVIPILNLWAAYRIGKLRRFLLILLLIWVVNVPVSFLVPFPFSIPVKLLVYAILVILYLKKWTVQWNNKTTLAP
jgi:hypothetical protein